MLTPTVGSTNSTAAAQASNNDLGDKDIFLKLLVAQMQYQNPLKPQDPTQMSAQLAQFNMVEQQTNTNRLLEKLVQNGGATGTSSAQPLSSAASYLGHSVTINQNQINYNGTDQNFIVDLDGAASQVRVTLFDESGAPVRTMNLSNMVYGANTITWDGLADSGATAAQGNYSIDVSATDIQGNNVNYTVQRMGIVDAVRFTPEGTELMVDGIAAPLSAIAEIRL